MAQTNHILPKTGFNGLLENWRSDFLAAISVSLVALPLGLGIAVASGAPAISGITSAVIGGLVVTLFRGSHLAINGPAAGLIAVVLGAIVSLDDGTGQALNYVLAATCVAGVIQVVLGLLKMGRIAEIIPSSVIQGIMVAIGIIIFTSQMHVALGTTSSGKNTIEAFIDIFRNLPSLNPIIAAVSLVGVLLLVILPRVESRIIQFFPATLWVLVVSIPLAYLFNFFEPHAVSLFSRDYEIGPQNLIQIPSDLSKAIVHPNFSKINTMEFWVAVLSITLIASIQTLAMAKAVDKLDPYKRVSNLNKDLIGVGMGTMVAGLIGGIPIITVIVRSTVNVANNAKTKWSNFYHGLLLIIFVVILTPIIQKVPLAALAAILVYIGFRLASPATFKKVYEMGIEQLIFMAVTVVITLYSDLLIGILVGTSFTLLVHILLARMPVGMFFGMALKSESQLVKKEENEYDLVLRGIANFLSIPKLASLTESIPSGASVNIDMSGTRLVGMTYMDKLIEFLNDQRDSGGHVVIKGLDHHVSSSDYNRSLKILLSNNVNTKLTPRQNGLKSIAEKSGLIFDSAVNWNTSLLKKFQFFEIRPLERKSNCLRGKFNNKEVQWEIADVTFNEGASFSAEVYNSTIMTIQLNKVIPKFIMEKEGFVDRLFDKVMAFSGYRDIDFELYPDFSKKILFMGQNEYEMKSFFTKELIQFFEGENVQHIECSGDSLLIFNKLKIARTDEVERMVGFAERLVKALNRKKTTNEDSSLYRKRDKILNVEP